MDYNFEDVVIKFNSVKEKLLLKIGERDAINTSINNYEVKLSKLKKSEKMHEDCTNVLQKVSNIMKTNTIKNIESLITEGLNSVIAEENLKFIIQYDSKGSYIQAKYKIYDKISKVYYDIIDSFGGGVADIISIINRIIFIYKFNTAKILVLDESGKWISGDKQIAFGKFLSDVSTKLGIQTILITHKDVIAQESDMIVKVRKQGDQSVLEVIKGGSDV